MGNALVQLANLAGQALASIAGAFAHFGIDPVGALAVFGIVYAVCYWGLGWGRE